jgi:hypothetical protein
VGTGTSLSVFIYVFAAATGTFTSVYLITETFEGEMTEDVIEEGVATSGRAPRRADRSLARREEQKRTKSVTRREAGSSGSGVNS